MDKITNMLKPLNILVGMILLLLEKVNFNATIVIPSCVFGIMFMPRRKVY